MTMLHVASGDEYGGKPSIQRRNCNKRSAISKS
jgi:hypothetical protein